MLEKLQEWKETPIDALALSLFRLSQFHVNEIRCDHHGLGDNILCNNSQIPSRNSNLPAMYNPTDIVDQIHAGTSSNVMSSAPSAIAGMDVSSLDVADNELGNTATNMNVNSAALSATASTSSMTDCGSVNGDDVEPRNVVTNSQLTSHERADEVIRSEFHSILNWQFSL